MSCGTCQAAASQAVAPEVPPEMATQSRCPQCGRFMGDDHVCPLVQQQDGATPVRERAQSGDTLGRLGAPRFRAEAWHLPDEPLLGFVEVPEGPFPMGTRKKDIPALLERFGGDRRWYGDESPQHDVALPAYHIARYPVTVAQFRAFVEAGGYREARYWREAQAAGVWRDGKVKERPAEEPRDKPPHGYGYGESNLPSHLNHPVVGVTWYEALAYCRWLTETLREWEGAPEPLASLLREEGWQVCLPSEAEWEKAARGTNGHIFPWGDEPDANRASCNDMDIDEICAVGRFPDDASPYGCQDMSGNLREWTRSVYKGYPYDPEDGREDLEAKDARALRGGPCSRHRHDHCESRAAFRFIGQPEFGGPRCGFRLIVHHTEEGA
jgi:formylglycine-generating enzyme required for sulfatase activity